MLFAQRFESRVNFSLKSMNHSDALRLGSLTALRPQISRMLGALEHALEAILWSVWCMPAFCSILCSRMAGGTAPMHPRRADVSIRASLAHAAASTGPASLLHVLELLRSLNCSGYLRKIAYTGMYTKVINIHALSKRVISHSCCHKIRHRLLLCCCSSISAIVGLMTLAIMHGFQTSGLQPRKHVQPDS